MNIGFIGTGKMGEAIISKLVTSGTFNAENIGACDISGERRKTIGERYGVNVFGDSSEMLDKVDTIFLAVKPQDMDALLPEIKNKVNSRHLVVSIAAGKKIGFLETNLPGARIVRVMPNIATLVAEGMTVFCTGTGVTPKDQEETTGLLSCFGQVLALPEDQFDAVTALSGSGPAFFAHFLKLMTNAGVELGLETCHADALAKQTMLGTIKLLMDGGFDADSLIAAVSSRKGTTEAGFEVLRKAPLQDIITDTLKAAADRSRELSE